MPCKMIRESRLRTGVGICIQPRTTKDHCFIRIKIESNSKASTLVRKQVSSDGRPEHPLNSRPGYAEIQEAWSKDIERFNNSFEKIQG